MNKVLPDANATSDFAKQLASQVRAPFILYLKGPLGAGKTTFCRAFIRYFGYEGPVKSPTYTLVETYDTTRGPIHHFDCYRLAHPDELEYLGTRELLGQDAICLIEWPEQGQGALGTPDLVCELTIIDNAREIQCQAQSAAGQTVLQSLS